MSNNVRVNGIDYSGIAKVQLNTPDGATVVFGGDSGGGGSTGGGEKILYMDAALLNAGGAYPVDADDYTTAVIPVGATFVSLEAFTNMPNLDTLIILGDCEFEVYEQTVSKSTYYYNAIVKNGIPIRKVIILATTPDFFMYNTGTLVEVDVSGSVGKSAFRECYNLGKITLENCETIGNAAFYGCSGLTEITIPASVTSIGNGAFTNCSGLTEITIPDGVTSVDWNVFSGCSGLTEITIPDGVTSIPNYTFQNCSGLTEITIPAGANNIGMYAFDGCTNLATITILGTATTITDTTAIPTTTKIRGYAGSAAETFANDNGYTFEVIE